MRGRAAVVGGGIGGLATAVRLGAHGWDVEVHERSDALPDSGTALGIWPSALRALDTLGLGVRARQLGAALAGCDFRRSDGSWTASVDMAAMRRRTGDAVCMLARPTLLGLLAGELTPDALRLGSAVSSVDEVRDADVVVAADGLNSRIRTELFGARYRARYTGNTAWRGSATGTVGKLTETWGDRSLFGSSPVDGGRTNWYASTPALEGDRAPDSEAEALRRHFGGWHAGVRDVLDHLDETTVQRHGLYYVDPPLPSYVRGKVALVGDAAHAMSPVVGRGGCEALLDGVALADCLAESSLVADALAAYDARRRGPTQRLARVATLGTRAVRLSRMTRLRDLGLKAAVRAMPMD